MILDLDDTKFVLRKEDFLRYVEIIWI